jgi:hypothetical protein
MMMRPNDLLTVAPVSSISRRGHRAPAMPSPRKDSVARAAVPRGPFQAKLVPAILAHCRSANCAESMKL